jgi:hypothetical protein
MHQQAAQGLSVLCLRALVTGDEDNLEALLVFVGHLVRGGQLRGESCVARQGGGMGGAKCCTAS